MPNIVYVDELVDRQKLSGRNYFLLAVLMVALLCDGFDLQVVAFAAPRIAKDWSLPPASFLQYVIAANLFGMMIGATMLGNLGDRFGRKRVIVTGTLLYAFTALLCLLAKNPTQLGIIRFFTGLGLGGVLPNVIALAAEVSPTAKRPLLTSIPMIGMSLGSGMPAIVAAWLVPQHGWQSLFVAGCIVPVVVAALIYWKLPESILFLTYRGKNRREIEARARQLDPSLMITPDTQFTLRQKEKKGASRSSFSELFAGKLAITTPLLWLMFACTLLSVHFLNSWISVILNQAGLSDVQTAFTNGALHWGGTIAAIFTVFLLGRLGLAWALILLVLGFSGCLIIATNGFASATLLTLAVCMAGFGIVGCQGVLNTSAGLIYPVSCRPTGAGAALGIGRVGSLSGPLVGAWVLDLHWPSQSLFYVPLLPLAIAAIATLTLMLRKVEIRGEASAAH
ncbi:MAG TPA: MFS transporter [Steroidobacteraceae bacterium]|nr:MFS transporter [Steroidobacteraceae bacterium]